MRECHKTKTCHQSSEECYRHAHACLGISEKLYCVSTFRWISFAKIYILHKELTGKLNEWR